MSNFNVINDIDALYDDPITQTESGFICNVCKKQFKGLGTVQKHVTKKDCYKPLDVFKNTQNEIGGFELYKHLILNEKPTARISLTIFRRSPYYGGCVKGFMFCNINEIQGDMIHEYASWVNVYKKTKKINSVISIMRDENSLREFRKFCRVNQHIAINSAKFFRKYKDELLNDHLFLVRSLEKAKTGILFLINEPEFSDEFFESLPYDYQERIEELLKEVS